MTSRGVAMALIVCAAGYVLAARSFESGFIADPIGPRAFPFGIGTLLLLSACGVALERPREPVAGLRPTWRQWALLASIVVYAAVLPRLGFIASTSALGWVSTLVSGGPPGRGLLWSVLLTVGVFAVFVLLLGIPLPGPAL